MYHVAFARPEIANLMEFVIRNQAPFYV